MDGPSEQVETAPATFPMTIRSARPDELSAIQILLRANGLPADDLVEHLEHFIVAEDAMRLAGVVGLEAYGEVGLLRSLAVDSAHRGAGLGARLCASLEARARTHGIHTLFLLTMTAEAYFAARGYERVRRESAPAQIAATGQFAQLCPATAICMQKHLT